VLRVLSGEWDGSAQTVAHNHGFEDVIWDDDGDDARNARWNRDPIVLDDDDGDADETVDALRYRMAYLHWPMNLVMDEDVDAYIRIAMAGILLFYFLNVVFVICRVPFSSFTYSFVEL